MTDLLSSIRSELILHSEPHKLPQMQRFFKEPIDAYCTYTAHVRAISREHKTTFAALTPKEREDLTKALWESGKFEEGSVAIQLYSRILRQCSEREWRLFSKWLDKYVQNWAHCDALCAEILGPMLIRHPDSICELLDWTRSELTYKRRAALVAPLKGLRKGLFRAEAQQLDNALADTKEDILKKALRWLRKECADFESMRPPVARRRTH